MNPFEILKSAFTPLIDGEKKPLHVGEVMNFWFCQISDDESDLRTNIEAAHGRKGMDPDSALLQPKIKSTRRPRHEIR